MPCQNSVLILNVHTDSKAYSINQAIDKGLPWAVHGRNAEFARRFSLRMCGGQLISFFCERVGLKLDDVRLDTKRGGIR